MELDHHIHSITDGAADLFEGFEGDLEFGRADIVTVVFFGGEIEGPYLHCGDPLGEEVLGELAGAVKKGVEIVVARGGAQSPIGRVLPFAGAHITCAGASVVRADRGPGEAAEKLRDRLLRRFAKKVPERDIEGGIAAYFCARRAEAEIAGKIAREPVDRQRVAAKRSGRQIF